MQQRQDETPQDPRPGDRELTVDIRGLENLGVDPQVIQRDIAQVVSKYTQVSQASVEERDGIDSSEDEERDRGSFLTIFTPWRWFRPRRARRRRGWPSQPAPHLPQDLPIEIAAPPQPVLQQPEDGAAQRGGPRREAVDRTTEAAHSPFEGAQAGPIGSTHLPQVSSQQTGGGSPGVGQSHGESYQEPMRSSREREDSPVNQAPPRAGSGNPSGPPPPSGSDPEPEDEDIPSNFIIDPATFEMAEMSDKARDELEAIQRVRARAAHVRMRAQEAMAEAEAAQDEAERAMAEARYTFSKALALNPDALKDLAAMIRKLEEAIRTEGELRQLTRQQAEEEADWARQRATEAILGAVTAVRKASSHVSRELEESRRVSKTAESLKGSAQDHLSRAQSMKAGAESLVRQEARKLLERPLTEGSVPPLRATRPARPISETLPPAPASRTPAPPPTVSPGVDTSQAPPLSPVAEPAPAQPAAVSPSPAADTGQALPLPPAREPAATPPPTMSQGVDAGQTPTTPLPREPGRGDDQPVGPVSDRLNSEEQTPARRDKADIESPVDLAAALNEFLNSLERSEPAPLVEQAPTEQAPTVAAPREGLFLDNLDFSSAELEVTQEQMPRDEEVRPGRDVEAPAPPPSPRRQDTETAEEEFNDDLLSQLRDSLASIRTPGQPLNLSPTDIMEELPVSSPPARAQGIAGAAAQFEAPPAVDQLRTSPPTRQSPEDLGHGLTGGRQASTPPVSPPMPSIDQPPPLPEPAPRVPESAQSAPLAPSYKGTLHIVFAPAADAATLSFFWDIVDTVAGVGKVVAQTSLPDGSGHEFTLDLGNDPLDLEQLRTRIPGSDIMALGPDRLRIHLAPMAD